MMKVWTRWLLPLHSPRSELSLNVMLSLGTLATRNPFEVPDSKNLEAPRGRRRPAFADFSKGVCSQERKMKGESQWPED